MMALVLALMLWVMITWAQVRCSEFIVCSFARRKCSPLVALSVMGVPYGKVPGPIVLRGQKAEWLMPDPLPALGQDMPRGWRRLLERGERRKGLEHDRLRPGAAREPVKQ